MAVVAILIRTNVCISNNSAKSISGFHGISKSAAKKRCKSWRGTDQPLDLAVRGKSLCNRIIFALQIVSEDLRVFVEVLQAFCDDPRDLVEVRSNEAKLKSQLAVLQKQMKGHELQVGLESMSTSSLYRSSSSEAFTLVRRPSSFNSAHSFSFPAACTVQ